MAPEWEAAMGMELGMGTTSHAHYHNAPPAATTSTMAAAAAPFSHFHFSTTAGNPMRVDELLDLSSHLGAHDFFPGTAAGAMHGEPTPPPSAAAASSSDHHTSSFNLSFADEFYIPVPTEEAAELEWLSNFVDDSYPDVPNYPPAVQAAMAAAARNGAGQAAGQLENSVSAAPGRGARSKRSRAASAAAAAWHALVPRQPSPSSSSSSSDLSSSKPARSGSGGGKKSELGGENNTATEAGGAGVRRCTHCASEKTPQWRTGPLGPKTLCNACGVRYKSGRLVPEYRPAASPTFVLTQHSNSHRKVMELRRQNELLHLRGSAASGSGGGGGAEHMFRDYGVC